MKCDRCESENRDDRKFCHKCGSPLPRVCSNCGFLNESDARYCGECGRFLNAESQAIKERFVPAHIPIPAHLLNKMQGSRTPIEGERRQVTVLFADMQDYTPLAERLGEEKVYEVMNRVYARMLDAVHQYEGMVQELTGDGILALFGAPIALENAPIRACQAALEIQQKMHALGLEIETECGVLPRVRIGIHTGPVVVGTVGTNLKMEFKAVGDTVNLASRLESMAEPETILISEVTHRLVDAYTESAYLDEQKVKGKSELQKCYRLQGMMAAFERFDASLRRGLTPLVGLEQELQFLKEKLRESQQGTAQVVDVVAEAGNGKSRLMYEFKRSLLGGSVLILEMQCATSGQSTAFFPVVAILKSMFHLHEHMVMKEVERKVLDGLKELGLKPDPILPLLLNLLGIGIHTDEFRGLDAEIIGARTRDVLKDVCEAYCRSSTTIILIEDLHWIDTSTAQLLQNLILVGQPLGSLILTTCRPEYVHPWAGNRNVARLELTPLTADNCAQLARHCLGSFAQSEDMVKSVVQRVEGNPLFAEEMSRYLIDAASKEQIGSIPPLSDYGIDGPLPESLRDIIMARVDRLGEVTRELLQTMSVIGREFSSELMQRIWPQSKKLPGLISNLKDTGLITVSEHGSGEIFYFKHILIQEAVYDSLLENRRIILHEQVAQALESLNVDCLSEYAEMLAYHWKKSAQPKKAIPFLAMAGEKSLGMYSLEEANQWFQQVVKQIGASPDINEHVLLVDALLNWARVYYYRKDFKGLINILEGHLECIESLGDRRRLSLALFWLGFSHYVGARYDTARTMLHKALELGQQQKDIECIGYASLGLMFVCANLQDESPEESLELYGSQVLEAASQLSDVYLESKYLLCMTIHTIYMSRFCDAAEFCLRMRKLGERASDPRTIAMSQWSLGLVNIFEEQYEEALKNAEASLKRSPDPLDKLMARTVNGAAHALKDDPVKGLSVLQEVRSEMFDAGYIAPLLGVDIPYGAAIALAGKMRAGVRWIKNSIERFAELGNKTQPALGRLVLGEIYLQMALGENKPPLGIVIRNLGFILTSMPFAARSARQYLEQAASEFRQSDAPANLARALLDLAILNHMQKRTDEAEACLIEASSNAESQAHTLHVKITQMLQQLNYK